MTSLSSYGKKSKGYFILLNSYRWFSTLPLVKKTSAQRSSFSLLWSSRGRLSRSKPAAWKLEWHCLEIGNSASLPASEGGRPNVRLLGGCWGIWGLLGMRTFGLPRPQTQSFHLPRLADQTSTLPDLPLHPACSAGHPLRRGRGEVFPSFGRIITNEIFIKVFSLKLLLQPRRFPRLLRILPMPQLDGSSCQTFTGTVE